MSNNMLFINFDNEKITLLNPLIKGTTCLKNNIFLCVRRSWKNMHGTIEQNPDTDIFIFQAIWSHYWHGISQQFNVQKYLQISEGYISCNPHILHIPNQ